MLEDSPKSIGMATASRADSLIALPDLSPDHPPVRQREVFVNTLLAAPRSPRWQHERAAEPAERSALFIFSMGEVWSLYNSSFAHQLPQSNSSALSVHARQRAVPAVASTSRDTARSPRLVRFHRSRQTAAEYDDKKLQRRFSRRMFESVSVHEPGRGSRDHRKLERGLQATKTAGWSESADANRGGSEICIAY